MGFLARLENGLFLFLAKTQRRKGFLLAGSKKKKGGDEKKETRIVVSLLGLCETRIVASLRVI